MKKIFGYTLLSIFSIVIFLALVIPLNSLRSIEGIKDYFIIIAPIYSIIFFTLLNFLYSKIFFRFGVKNKIFLFKTKPLLTIFLTIIIFSIVYYVLLLVLNIDYHLNSKNLASLLPGLQAPLLEEIIFRGYLLHTFIETKCNKYLSLIIVSLIFGALHMINYFLGDPISLSYILGVAAGGILLGSIYIRFGLWISIIVHYLWNSSNSLFLKANDLETNVEVHIILIIISVCILLIRKKKTK
ncbi:MAG: type II CAAX endopeptidase family protein [Psychrilyobacter sp.]|uniref:CPBP family intramembrane glutamic endopeptidase n=1 Tax=Psychrilyobacter sp. TaxID=2586924 RepID=UPI003C70BE5E